MNEITILIKEFALGFYFLSITSAYGVFAIVRDIFKKVMRGDEF